MKTTETKRFAPIAAAIAMMLVGTSALAATDWDYTLSGSSLCNPATGSGTYVAECNATAPDLTMSGWSTGTGTTSAPTAGTAFAKAMIYDWGSAGLGVVASNESSGATGPHATDNRFGTDAILLSFTNAIDLESVKIGWNGTDNAGTYDTGESSDISILAYTGSTPPAPTMSGATLTNLTSSGWKLVGHYGQVGGLANNTAVITSAITSSYWLISAYSAGYGSAGVSSSSKGITAGNDYFKLVSITGNNAPTQQTPEPGGLALVGLGLLGLMASRRRSTK